MTWPIYGLAALLGVEPSIGTAFVTVGAMAFLPASPAPSSARPCTATRRCASGR